MWWLGSLFEGRFLGKFDGWRKVPKKNTIIKSAWKCKCEGDQNLCVCVSHWNVPQKWGQSVNLVRRWMELCGVRCAERNNIWCENWSPRRGPWRLILQRQRNIGRSRHFHTQKFSFQTQSNKCHLIWIYCVHMIPFESGHNFGPQNMYHYIYIRTHTICIYGVPFP